METTEKLVPSFGTYHANTYMVNDPNAVWGARLIAPDDLLPDRQDLVARNDDAKQALIRWLNGQPAGQGAIRKMLEACEEHQIGKIYGKIDGTSNNSMVLYEDDQGIIVGSPQGSCGYVYVSGWLK